MKILAVFSVSILLVGILFCPVVRAAPSMPEEFEIVSPDPSLPKELRAFFGKYEGFNGLYNYFVIVAQIDKEKATLHIWREGSAGQHVPWFLLEMWETINAEVIKQRGEYQLWYRSNHIFEDNSWAKIDGKYLKLITGNGIIKLSRVSETRP